MARLLGMTEAARRLRVHPATLVRWEALGKVSPERDSAGRRIFLAEDVDRLVAERATKRTEAQR